MYDDSIKVANKIISYNDLSDIFARMYEDLNNYIKISQNEERRNQVLDYSHQIWTFKDNGSKLHFTIYFHDGNEISFDNYNNFITVFNNRLEEIKSIYARYHLSYSTSSPEVKSEWHNETITMWLYEDKAEFSFSLSSTDRKMDHIYELIKSKVADAPVKYDDVIKNKSSINSSVGLAIAFIPSLILCTLLLFVPTIRTIFTTSCVLYPIVCLMIAFLLSGTMSSWKLDDLYKPIVPDKKYINYEKGYKDDIDKYLETSEILIGKNTRNLENRKQIMNEYKKYKKYIPYEIGVLILLSIIVIFIGKI